MQTRLLSHPDIQPFPSEDILPFGKQYIKSCANAILINSFLASGIVIWGKYTNEVELQCVDHVYRACHEQDIGKG